jgi:hypothetical protein
MDSPFPLHGPAPLMGRHEHLSHYYRELARRLPPDQHPRVSRHGAGWMLKTAGARLRIPDRMPQTVRQVRVIAGMAA